ncbi:hypothetical protein JCM3774_000912 [Rhodotorula dairenensis]
MTGDPLLFRPFRVGRMELGHRIAMAPLTRYRADDQHVHHDLAVEYYGQRACEPGRTLLITEATFIDPVAGGYTHAPGCCNAEQVAAWKKIVDEVHAKGSFICLQLWALGRAANPDVLRAESGAEVVSASDIPLAGGATPRPLTKEEIQDYVGYYAHAARLFVEEAGGDGVEIHNANGYLLDQFLQSVSNNRTDEYGGSIENRARFPLEVARAVTEAVGPDRVGIRISPFSTFQGMKMPTTAEIKATFGYFVQELANRHPDLAYLHSVEARFSETAHQVVAPTAGEDLNFIIVDNEKNVARQHDIWYPRPLLLAGGFSADSAYETAEQYPNVVIAFGRFFISNPDLVRRIKEDLPFAPSPLSPDNVARALKIPKKQQTPFRVSVDEHELLVIEADDTPVHASPAHRIQINTAQRYSALLSTTGHKKGDSFYLRSQMNTDCLGLPFPDLDPQARVVIRIGNEYDHLGSALPTSVDWNDPTTGACTELEAASLLPLIARRAPSKADHISVFNSSLAVPNGIFKGTLNDATFENFAFDPLLQRVQRGEPIPPMRVAVVTAGLEVIDPVIQNVLGADHPFHLHNSPMFVLSSGPGLISPEEASQLQHNLTNPLRRDAITVAPGTWQVVRIITDIPGCLLFHCHIVFHQVQGLLGVLLVQEDRIRSLQIPQDNVDLCRGGNMSMIDPGRKRALPTGPVSLGLSVA